MTQQSYPSLNDIEPSWADIALTLPIAGGASVSTEDFAAVKWSDKVDVGIVRGASGGRKKRRTTGQYDCDASITFYSSGWTLFQAALAAVNEKISLVVFDALIQYTPPGATTIKKVKLVGCRVVGRGEDASEGTDAIKNEVPLSVMRIEVDGASLL